MKIEQIYTGCLAQGAYYIVSGDEAVIIDPLRETEPYLQRLEQDQVKLKYILETHFHADFVSGHLDLSQKTNAPIVYGPNANPNFETIIAEDNQILEVGKIKIKVIHTPGHTLESTCYLLLDENNKEVALFSGDTLFLGDVGRPDLSQKLDEITTEDLAGFLYDSLYQKIIPLADDVVVYPAHGAGSACGKNMQKETFDTLGNQKKSNYALNQPSKKAFIKAVTDGLLPPPKYFGKNAELNKKGYNSFDDVFSNSQKSLSTQKFEDLSKEGDVLILDVRAPKVFAEGFVPNSINIGLNGDFAPWVGAIIGDVNQKILLVAEENQIEETITRLSRVGFDNVLGYLENGINSWQKSGRAIDVINQITAQELEDKISQNVDVEIIDVRKESEFLSQRILNAKNYPLSQFDEWKNSINLEKPFILHCAGGYRSSIAASLLKKNGIRNFAEVEGGFAEISKTNIKTSAFVCPSQL